MNSASSSLGGQWLCETYGLSLVSPLAVASSVGSRRASSITEDGIRTEIYQRGQVGESTLRGSLAFHLKNEVVNLELLSRLFAKVDPVDLMAWVHDEPNGRYARRAGFLYEWLTDKTLDVSNKLTGSYVEALDKKDMVVAVNPVRNAKWNVLDNLPGTREFCPTVRKTRQSERSMALDCQALLAEITEEFGANTLLKSAVWLTKRESKASFQIEGEAHQTGRIQRFAEALGQYTGSGDGLLSDSVLGALQRAILGSAPANQAFGIRQSPVFIGANVNYQEHVHYIAPASDDVPSMLKGLQSFIDKTQGLSPVMRSAVASFGFVYIHPLADGNGRIHRLLINDILRRDGAVPEPLIIPVSGWISRGKNEQLRYEKLLDTVSEPLMKQAAGKWEFSVHKRLYPDGIVSNFVFDGDSEARHAWRYADLTPHVEYLSDVIAQTISEDMRMESSYLRSHGQARSAIKGIVELPDDSIDRIIRSWEQTKGKLSNVLAKEISALREDGVWAAINDALETAFSDPVLRGAGAAHLREG